MNETRMDHSLWQNEYIYEELYIDPFHDKVIHLDHASYIRIRNLLKAKGKINNVVILVTEKVIHLDHDSFFSI